MRWFEILEYGETPCISARAVGLATALMFMPG
jgi:hypothetical protein